MANTSGNFARNVEGKKGTESRRISWLAKPWQTVWTNSATIFRIAFNKIRLVRIIANFRNRKTQPE